MVWIEMSRDEEHGGVGWGFTECLWSPTTKKNGGSGSWLFWENVLNVKADDVILHLRGKNKNAYFVGTSYAESDGHITTERPSIPGEWGYSNNFYRVFLKEYVPFSSPINLLQLFQDKQSRLEQYLNTLERQPKNIFFTKQSGRLQCLNGAYLSLADEKLVAIILNTVESQPDSSPAKVPLQSETAESWRTTKQRIGHAKFAKNVKANYNHSCCFPACKVNNKRYLVASHIARWADNEELRGDTSNGLCLCVLHDKAFEIGDFSINDDYKIITNSSEYFISPFLGQSLQLGIIQPSLQALKEHRLKNGYPK